MTELKLKYNGTHKESRAKEEWSEGIESNSNGDGFYVTPSNARNICFALADGKHIFFNYGYLISGEFHSSLGIIVLNFTTHLVTINGRHLDSVFNNLQSNMIQKLSCFDVRYIPIANEQYHIVESIQVEKREDIQ